MRAMSIEDKIDVFYDLVGGRVSEKGRPWAALVMKSGVAYICNAPAMPMATPMAEAP